MADATLNRFEWLKAVLQTEGLSGAAKNIASALAVQFANAETGQINPSQETLADYLKLHRDTIKRALRELRNSGWLMATGDGGRGKAPMMRLLTPGRIVPFRAPKGGVNHPPQADKRGDVLQQKGGGNAPPLYKDKQSLEQKGAQCGRRPTIAPQLFGRTKFKGSKWEGVSLILSDNSSALNAWADWLSNHGFPKLCQLPIFAENGKLHGFHLPTTHPPSTSQETDQAKWFFQTLMDSEAATHAAQ